MSKPVGIRQKADAFMQHYEHMRETFERLFGYQLFFVSGSLLGYVRENDFIAHDDDMDVAWFSRHKTVELVRRELIWIMDTLLDNGESLYLMRPKGSIVNNYIRWKVDDADRIDVMPMWEQDGMIYRPTFVGYPAGKDIILPLQEREFYGKKIYIPNQPEKKLALVFGDTWRIPDPDFSHVSCKYDKMIQMIDVRLGLGPRMLKHFLQRTGEWSKISWRKKAAVLFPFLLKLRRVFTKRRSK